MAESDKANEHSFFFPQPPSHGAVRARPCPRLHPPLHGLVPPAIDSTADRTGDAFTSPHRHPAAARTPFPWSDHSSRAGQARY
jgi:hypothetical protein